MAKASAHYTPNTFDSAAFRKVLERLATAWGSNVEDLGFKAFYSQGQASDEKEITLGEAETLSGIVPPLDHLMISYGIGTTSYRTAHFIRRLDGMEITVYADDMISSNSLLKYIVEVLSLSPYELRFSDELLERRIDDIESRVTALETTVAETPLKCFLSFRFSDTSSAIAREVEQFLSLLGIEVVSGIEYEPRRVEDKVRDRILSGVDFVVYLITSEGESSWLRDELATATAQGAIPIPLIEDGCILEEGLLGNIEYIPFSPGHPGDSWIRLVQAVRYIETVKFGRHGH
ncbi:MAG: hypothetical protein Q7J85_09690 [Bacillota bacterium]|nr:hypothetical protein [Bacillota bacterium]